MIKLTKQFVAGGSKEQPVSKSFKNMDEAKAFALESLQSDAAMRIQTVYRIYDFDDLMVTIDASALSQSSGSSESSGSSQGQGTGARFSPSPLQNAPRPPGMPANNWVVPKDDEDKDKK